MKQLDSEKFAKRALELMSQNGYTYESLASVIPGTSASALQRYFTGGSKKVPMDLVLSCSEIFGVDVLWLAGSDEKPPRAHKIPVYGKVAAGFPIEMVEEVLDYEEIPAKWGDPSDFFCLQIKGDSMKPKIEEGDVVVVHKQADADTGSVVIASIKGEEATCKKLRKTDNGIFLMPTNNDYEPIFFTNEDIESLPVKILGKVVELRAKF